MNIRPIDENDTDALEDFFNALSERTKYFFRPHPFDRAMAEKLTGEDLRDPGTRRFGAFTGSENVIMAGYVFFWDWAEKMPWLGIAVRDGYQGAGLGQNMLEYAIRDAKTNNKEGITLTTMKDNFRAQALYKKLGFVITGESANGEHVLELKF